MPFDSGPLSFCMCHMPRQMPDDVLSRFSTYKAASLDAVTDEPQFGWVSGRHLLETRIDEETAYAGGYLHLCLRTAQRKIPPSLLKAECKVEELAFLQANDLVILPRKERTRIKAEVTERLIAQMPPTLSGIFFVHEPKTETLYLGASSESKIEDFLVNFCEVVKFEPVPLAPATLAEVYFDRCPDDLPVLQFSAGLGDNSVEPHLGRDFATWLWFFQEEQGGAFHVEPYGDFAIMIDGPLTFAAEAGRALETVVRKGVPMQSAEAKAALTVGKKLRQARYVLACEDRNWAFMLDADRFVVRAMTLPPGEELEPHSHFQERVLFLTMFRAAFLQLVRIYLDTVTDEADLRALAADLLTWVENLRAD